MDFVGYAEATAGLLNAPLPDREALVGHLAERPWLLASCTERDATVLRRFQRELRPVFEASDAADVRGVVAGLNQLMEKHPLSPVISDHDPDRLHLHVAKRDDDSVSQVLIGEALLGLTTLVCDLGPTRMGVCSEVRCSRVYVDTSPNQSRRYCSDRCSSRANVAAFRARRRACAV